MIYRHRPRWLGRLAMAWFNGRLPMPGSWAPYVLGIALGSKPNRMP